jgi:hypothetical protein
MAETITYQYLHTPTIKSPGGKSKGDLLISGIRFALDDKGARTGEPIKAPLRISTLKRDAQYRPIGTRAEDGTLTLQTTGAYPVTIKGLSVTVAQMRGRPTAEACDADGLTLGSEAPAAPVVEAPATPPTPPAEAPATVKPGKA